MIIIIRSVFDGISYVDDAGDDAACSAHGALGQAPAGFGVVLRFTAPFIRVIADRVTEIRFGFDERTRVDGGLVLDGTVFNRHRILLYFHVFFDPLTQSIEQFRVEFIIIHAGFPAVVLVPIYKG